MLKITLENIGVETLIFLEGRLTGPWVAELYKVVLNRLTNSEAIRLELENLTYVNDEGLALLRDLLKWGVSLGKVSPFIKELLKNELLC
jgi:hypothetical protein